MKFRILLTSVLLLLTTTLVLMWSTTACSDSKASTLPPAEEQFEIPSMLMRTEGLGSEDEKIFMITRYDEAVATLRENPANVEAKIQLAEIFMIEARVTGEHPYYYPAALQMLNAALETPDLSPELRFQALNDLASVQLSLHDFPAALTTGEQAVGLYPMSAGPYGVLVDANVELGQYEAAVQNADQMVALRPDLRSYARISYLREIHGDIEGAIEAMTMAVSAGMPGFEETAWARLTLGQLYENSGQLDHARMHYTIALENRPQYPFAIAALARIERKNGNLEAAESLLDQAIELIPEVSFWLEKAAIRNAQGETTAVKQLADEALVMMQEDAESGHNMDLEIAKVYLELKGAPDLALPFALREYEVRPQNIQVNAVLGRIYYAQGNHAQAAKHFEAALRTGAQDPVTLSMAGLNNFAIGNKKEGKKQIESAFQSDPYQSHSYAEEAKSML